MNGGTAVALPESTPMMSYSTEWRMRMSDMVAEQELMVGSAWIYMSCLVSGMQW